MTGPFPGIYKKNGKWYHRNGGGPLPGHPSESKEASDAYWERQNNKHKRAPKRTMSALVESYLHSPNFLSLSGASQKEYERYARPTDYKIAGISNDIMGLHRIYPTVSHRTYRKPAKGR